MKTRLLAGGLLCLSPLVHALEFELGDELTISLDSTVTYAAAWRVEDRDDRLTGRDFLAALQEDPFLPLTDPLYATEQTKIINANDGNNNFDKGWISNRITYLLEMDARWRDYGLFVRGRAFYDTVYKDSSTDLENIDYATYNSGLLYGGDARLGEFPSQTRDEHGSVVEFLDFFAYATWIIPGDRLLDLRVGRQVINWGESTFYQGINSIQNRADARAANVPGVEVKEILLPTGAIYGQVDLLSNLTLELYYQYEWLETELNGVGSYFSTTDQVGPGAASFLTPTPGLPIVPEEIRGNEFHLRGVPLVGEQQASDDGQWGIAFHYVTEGNTDFGFYHVNGHDKKPSFVLDYIDVPGSPQPVPVGYRLDYFEDIKGTAASFTTVVGDTNLQGELSWLDGTPMVDAAGDPQRENLLKAQLGGSHLFGPSVFGDEVTVTFEGFYAVVDGASDSDLIGTADAVGYSVLATPAYKNVFSGWDINIPIYFKHDLDGSIAELQHVEGAKVLSIGVEGIYLNNLTTRLSYAVYSGGGVDNYLRDRDHLALNIKYSF